MNIFQLLSGVNNGTIDAKKEVLNMLNNMNPMQRQQARYIIPQVEQMAKQAGISTDGFNSEVSAHLK